MNVKEKSVQSKKVHPFRWGKCQKGTLTFTFFSLSTLFLNKNLPKPTGCCFLMEICFDKKFSNQLHELRTNISALDSNLDLAGSGGKDVEGLFFSVPISDVSPCQRTQYCYEHPASREISDPGSLSTGWLTWAGIKALPSCEMLTCVLN